MNKKVKSILIITICILVFILTLWISKLIPKFIGKIYSINYLKKNYSDVRLEYVGIEWSSSIDNYIVTFKRDNDENYNFVIGPKFFPTNFIQGISNFEDSIKNEKDIVDLDSFYNNSIAKEFVDIRNLPKEYTIKQAINDNCLVIGVMSNKNVSEEKLYNEFINKYNNKQSAFIRVVNTTIEGDLVLVDLLYDAKKDKVFVVKDNTRDKFSANEDRNIEFKTYEKTGVWKYQNTKYWVVYNNELPDGEKSLYTFDSDELYIIALIN